MGLSLEDVRIHHAATLALIRYRKRQEDVRATIEADPRCKALAQDERDKLARRLMKRLAGQN